MFQNSRCYGSLFWTNMFMNRIEKDLIQRIIEGNDGEFSLVLKAYLKPVYNFIIRLINDREAAEDVAQETFFKAWKNMRHFDPEKNFKTWLYTIAKRTAFDYLKKKKAMPFSSFEDENGNNFIDSASGEESIEKILEREDAARALDKALEKIPKHYQVILILRYKDDLSLQEIAEILGEPYNTVKSRHARALAKLNDVLTQNASGTAVKSYP